MTSKKQRNENKLRRKIKRLVFACDQNTVYTIDGENDEDDQPGRLMIRPKPETSRLLDSCYRGNIGMTFLVDEDFLEYSDYLPDRVEFEVNRKERKQRENDWFKKFNEDPDEILLISGNRSLRATAVGEGMQAASHPSIAKLLLSANDLWLCELEGAITDIQRCPDFVPYFLRKSSKSSRAIGAISASGIAVASRFGLSVRKFPVDHATHDLVLVKVDHWDKSAVAELEKRQVLAHDNGEVLIAVDASEDNDVMKIHGEHGHVWFLSPDPELLIDPPDRGGFADDAGFENHHQYELLGSIDRRHLEVLERIPDISINVDLLFPKCKTSAAQFQQIVDRYRGASPLDASGSIISREVRHPDNSRVVSALLKDLREMGYCAWTHSFTYGTRTVKNVIGELPGRGFVQIRPEILEKIKDLVRYPRPEPGPPVIDSLENLLGKEWSAQLRSYSEYRWELQRLAEIQLGIYHYPWWRCRRLAGFGARTVVVGCHLDSTAASSPGFDPASDPAPGADDDASGIAGTLAVAKFLIPYKGLLTHSVRFCFFNAEEVGIVGSQAYASYLKSLDTSVKAVICMDMIGYNSDAHRIFEVHAGYTDAAIRDLSVPIADQIALTANQLGKLGSAQIYKGTIPSSNPNRDTHDGAINRSDHSSFHAQGYPAVVVSEDFFVNQSGEPSSDGNPNYHRSGDNVIDSAYGADIACAVARAVKKLAQ